MVRAADPGRLPADFDHGADDVVDRNEVQRAAFRPENAEREMKATLASRRAPPRAFERGPERANEPVDDAIGMRDPSGLGVPDHNARPVHRGSERVRTPGPLDEQLGPAFRFFIRISKLLPEVGFGLEDRTAPLSCNVRGADVVQAPVGYLSGQLEDVLGTQQIHSERLLSVVFEKRKRRGAVPDRANPRDQLPVYARGQSEAGFGHVAFDHMEAINVWPEFGDGRRNPFEDVERAIARAGGLRRAGQDRHVISVLKEPIRQVTADGTRDAAEEDCSRIGHRMVGSRG